MAKYVKKIKSNAPIYIFGAVWLCYALIFPLYRPFDYIIVFVISIVAAILVSALLPAKEVVIEVDEPVKTTGVSEADTIIIQGQKYMEQLSVMEGEIQSPQMRQQVARLREVSRKIYLFLSEHPEQEKDVRMFNSYYMPTTLQTLNTYIELERSDPNFRGENVNKTMHKINEALTTFTTAYENLLDALYQNKTMDVQADITVLQQMMERQGLMDDEVKTNTDK